MEQVDLEYGRRPDGTLHVALAGEWKLARGIPAFRGVLEEIEKQPPPKRVVLETSVLSGWDSGLLTFLLAVLSRCMQLRVEVDRRGCPVGWSGSSRSPPRCQPGPAREARGPSPSSRASAMP
jgi:hypothetical protein